MKLKNNEIVSIAESLTSLYNRASDIKVKWNLANKSEPFIQKQMMLKREINTIIENEGEEKDGVKTIKTDNKSYLELMDCETDISFTPFSLDELSNVNVRIDELLALKKVIADGE